VYIPYVEGRFSEVQTYWESIQDQDDLQNQTHSWEFTHEPGRKEIRYRRHSASTASPVSVAEARAAPWTQARSPAGSSKNPKLSQRAYEECHRVGWDDAGILEIESNSRYRKYKESVHMAWLTNQISQPSLDISSIWIPSSVMRFLKHKENLCNETDFSCFSIRFRSRVFTFYFTDGTSGRYYMSSQFFFHLIALAIMHLVLLVMFVAQMSTSFSIPVPLMCMLYRNFYCILCWRLPMN
jgi:hypothetical protein